MASWLLTIDACPYVLGTPGAPAIGAIASWSDGLLVGSPVVVPDALVPPDFEIRELMHGVDAGLDWTAPTFTVNDVVPTSGVAAGQRLITWLATRSVALVTNTVLSATLAAGASTIALADATGFPASGTVWIDAEACNYAGKSGNTLTGVTRAMYFSRDVTHRVNASSGYYPAVFAAFQSFAGRRCVLYREDAGVATAVWRGYLRPGVELAPDGLRYQLATQSAWERHERAPNSLAPARVRLRGFAAAVARLIVAGDDTPWRFDTVFGVAADTTTFETLDALLDEGVRQLRAALLASGATGLSANWQRTGDGAIALRVFGSGAGTYVISLKLGARLASATSASLPGGTILTGGDPRSATASLPGEPAALAALRREGSQTLLVEGDLADLAAVSWATTTATDGPYTTTWRYVLRGAYGGYAITLQPTAVDVAARTLTCTVDVEPTPPPWGTTAWVLVPVDAPVEFTLTREVVSGHWIYAAQRGLLADDADSQSGVDPRDFDLAFAHQIAALTVGTRSAVTWHLDGTQTFGDVLQPLLTLAGCGLGVRGSKLAPVPFRVALESDAYAATVTSADLTGPPSWSVLQDGLCNEASVTQAGATLVVRDQRSIARHGPGRTVAADLDASGLALTGDARSLVTYLQSRLIGQWADPVAACTLPVTRGFGAGLGAGDFVRLQEWLCPTGAGDRGLGTAAALALLGQAEQRAMVLGRTLELPGNRILLHLLLPPTAPAWSPCARTASSAGATTVTLATAYIRGASDYAGSDLLSYRFAATAANDGGASWFAAGQRVQLVVRDSTSSLTEDLIVSAVNVATRVVTFTAAISTAMQTRINGGGVVDLRFSAYQTAGFLAAQQSFAAVASDTTRLIGGTTAAAKRFAP